MAQVASNASVASNSSEQAPLRIFYDRLAVALLGCLAILAILIGGPLAMAGVFSGAVPLMGLLLSIASFSTLRTLAVRDRRAKLLARMEATRERAMETNTVEPAAPQKRTAGVFDAQPNSNKRPPALTVQELRAEALRIANNGAAVQRPEGWELIEVPLPQYVVANAAQRATPAPLAAAAELKATTKTSLRVQEAAARLAEAMGTQDAGAATLPSVPEKITVPRSATLTEAPSVGEMVEGPVPAPALATAAGSENPSTDPAKTARAPRTEAERINLDDVMQRRRA